MKSSTVRIDAQSRALLHELAQRENQPQSVVLKYALEEYRRRLFLKRCGEAYAKLKTDSKVWEAEKADRDAWNATIDDGEKKDA